MTHQKLNNLLIAIIAFLTCLLIISTARADDFSWHVAGYAIFNGAPGAGYEPGVGGHAELYGRWKFLELKADGTIKNQHKKHAQSGHTYGYGLEGRAYVYGPWYVLASSQWAGYKTVFSDGRVWEKNGRNTGVGGGFNNQDTDVNLAYYFQEYESPNNIQFTALSLRQRIWKYLHGLLGVSYMTYDQGQERWDSLSITIGLGVKL